jgi:hypothetical protein
MRAFAQEPGEHLTPEDRAHIARWRAGEVMFVELTAFAEFDDGTGIEQTWNGTLKALTLPRRASADRRRR